MAHEHERRIYYDDTDFTGAVYHANYLRYCEHAREHLVGIDRLAEMWRQDGIGFAVYRAELRYRAPAHHGDRLVIHTTVAPSGPWRAVFTHLIHRAGVERPLVEATVELVCVDKAGKLVRIPESIVDDIVQRCA